MITLDNVCFSYPQAASLALKRISLTIAAGDFLLLTGATGCGKSTLLKILNGLIPHESGGRFSGKALISGIDVSQSSVASLSRQVGMMFQSPDDQIFSMTPYDEVAFSLEALGLATAEVRLRTESALRQVRLEHCAHASIHELSGGQKQRLALAAALATRPQILALDEPISQLDPQGAAELMEILGRLNRDCGVTVVLVEHRLHEVLHLCNRVAVMKNGSLQWSGTRAEALKDRSLFLDSGLRLPQALSICHALEIYQEILTVDSAVAAIRARYPLPLRTAPMHSTNAIDAPSALALEINDVWFSYRRQAKPVLRGITLQIKCGEFVALMGNNGAGKSTLLQQAAGLLQPDSGTVAHFATTSAVTSRSAGMVMQNPDLMLFNSSVRTEIAYGATDRIEANRLLQRLDLAELAERFPLALSRGQRLRTAVAAVLACRPPLLLLDEPTTGQDIAHIDEIVALLQEYVANGGSVIFCTHDVEVAARYANRIIVMQQGEILIQGRPAEIFSQSFLLQQAGLKQPVAFEISNRLYNGTALSETEVVSDVRQSIMGGYA